MTENTLPDDPADFDLNDWIETGTVARREVKIHNRPDLYERFVAIEAELEALGYQDPEDVADAEPDAQGDEALDAGGDDDAHVYELLEERAEIFQLWDESLAIWTVQAISQEQVDEAIAAVDSPKQPLPPKQGAPQRLQAEYQTKLLEYGNALEKVKRERRLYMISAAVISVETSRGTATGATVDQLRALQGRPHGQQWLDKLYNALTDATQDDVEIPRPTSPGPSTTALG